MAQVYKSFTLPTAQDTVGGILQESQEAADLEAVQIAQNRNDLERRIEYKKLRLADRAARRSRTAGEQIGDFASSAGAKGAIGLGQMLYGGAELLSQTPQGQTTLKGIQQLVNLVSGQDEKAPRSLDDATKPVIESIGGKGTLGQQFQKARQYIDTEFLSDPLAYSKEQINQTQARRAEGRGDRVDELIKEGHSKFMAEVLEEGKEFVNTLKDYADDPIAAVDIALESLPQLFVGGAVGQQVTKGLIKQGASKETIEKAATRAGISSAAAQEGLSNAVDAQAEVNNLSFDELREGSPMFNKLVEGGLTEEDAKAEVAKRAFQITGTISAAVGGAASKVTGAGKFEGNLFNKNTKMGNIINRFTRTATNTTKEAAEETIQGASGQLASNIAIKATANENKSIAEGVGTSAATGLVAGGLSGATVSTGKETVEAVSEAADAATKDLRTAIKDTEKVDEALSTPEKATEARNEAAESYEPNVAFDVAIDPSQVPTEPEARKKHIAELQTHADNAREELIQATKDVAAMPTDTEEQVAAQAARQKELNKEVAQVTQLFSRIEALKANNAEVTPANADEKLEDVKGNKDVLMGSVGNLSTEQLETLSTDTSLNVRERKYVESAIATNKAVSHVEELDSHSVNNDILHGKNGNMGITQHLGRITNYVTGGQLGKARDAYKQYLDFAKGHATKYQAVKAAFDAHVAKPNSEQALKLSNQVQEEYGLKIHKGSNARGLIDLMGSEVTALNTAGKQINALFNTKINKPKQAVDTSAVETQVEKPQVASTPVSETKTEQPIETKEIKETLDQNETIAKSFDKVEKPTSLLQTVPKLFKTLTTTNFYADKMSDAQKKSIVPVKNFQAKFSKKLDAVRIRVKKDDPFIDQDFTQHLVDEKGNLDENVAAAFGMVSMNWLATRAGDTLFNKDKDINSILGNDDESTIHPVANKVLRKGGSVRTGVAESIGKDIVKAIGLKAKDTTDGDAQAKLEMSAGQLALRTMAEQGFVEFSSIKNADLNKLRDEPSDIDSTYELVNFVKVTENAEGKLNDEVAKIREIIKDSDNLLDTLFGIQSYQTRPSLRKPEKVVDTIKGSFNKVPERIQKLIKKHQDRPVQNKHNVAKPFMFLSDRGRQIAAGANLDYENNTHITEHDSQEAINAGIERSINHFVEHYERTGNKKFYFSHNIVKNMRMMMQSNTVNMQSDKTHRHLMGYSNWEVEINPRNPDHMLQFFTAVAESMDVGVDKLNGRESWIEAKALYHNPVVQEAIDAINRINAGMYDEGQPKTNIPNRKETEETILAAIKMGKNNVFTLDGLAALAAYKKANGKPFKSNIFREVDGVTNGVIIGLYQLAAAGDYETLLKQLERGGVFSDDTTNWSDWYKKIENNDSYQDMAVDWANFLVTMDAATNDKNSVKDLTGKLRTNVLTLQGNPSALPAMKSLVGDFMKDGIVTDIARKLTKNPLMITNYGAAIGKTRREFSEKILAQVYSDLTKAGIKDDQVEVDRITKELSAVIGVELSLKASDVIVAKLSPKEEAKFKTMVDAYYGQALEFAIDSKFGTFIEHRTQLNKAMQIAFEAFNTVYMSTVKAAEAEVGRKLNKDEKMGIVMDLRDMVPSFKSPMAQGVEDSIVVMKEKKKRRKDKAAKVTVKHKKQAVKRISIDENGEVTEKVEYPKSTTTSISSYEYEDGGVSGTILGIHSIDAATMYGLLEQYSALNVHDAAAFSLLDVMEGTEALNKSFYDTLTGFNMREEIQESMERTIKILRGMNSKGDTVTFLRSIMSKGLLGKHDTLGKYLQDFRAETKRQNGLRKQVTDRLTHIQQYNPGQGGEYTPTKEKSTVAVSKQTEADLSKLHTKDFLNSSKKSIDPNNFGAQAVQQVNAMNQQAVFDAMGKLGNVQENPEHTTYLNKVLNIISTKIEDTIKLSLRRGGSETYGATRGNEVFINAGMGTLINGTQMSAQEVYVHELVHNVTRTGVDGSSLHKRELVKLFRKAEQHIKPEDFMNKNSNGDFVDANDVVITPQSADFARELAAATERYDYIFNNTEVNKDGSNNYLHEFMALGLTNQNFKNALSKISGYVAPESIKGKDLWETMVNLFSTIVESIYEAITGSRNLMADKKLMMLAERLASVDHKKKSTIFGFMDRLDFNPKAKEILVNYIAEPIIKHTGKALGKTNVKVIAPLGRAAAELVDTNAKDLGKTIQKVQRRMGITKDNLVNSLATEVAGATEDNNVFHVLLRKSVKMIDQARLHVKTGVIKQVNDNFLTDVTQSEKNSLTKALIKTDLSVLMDDFSYQDIIDFVGSEDKRNAEINKLENDLRQFKGRYHYYRKMAASLGSYMATGRHTEVQAHYNAYGIAHEDGTANTASDDAQDAIAIIDKLATLRAIDMTPVGQLQAAYAVMQREFKADGTNNGITFIMHIHRDYKKRSLDSLFGGNPTLMQKGFTKELYNPHVSVVVATLAEEETLIREGYTRELQPLKTDPDNPVGEPVYRYISRDSIVGTWDAGIASTTNNTAKGTDLTKVYLQQNIDNPAKEARTEGQRIFMIKDRKVNAVYSAKDTTVKGDNAMLNPIYNEQGEVTGYRYMMDEYTKDTVLEKDNSIDRVLGAMESTITDKMNTKEINNELVKTAKDDFDKRYSDDPDNYVVIGKNATNKDYLELYNLLPYEMKQEIKRVWGQDNMYVPEELVTMMFGRRKWSGAARLAQTKQFQKLNKIVLDKWNVNLGGKLVKFETIWQELVTTVKDIIVIKSGVVLLGNIMSNLVLLKTYGVPIKDIVVNHRIASQAAHEYQKDKQEADALERELRVNPNVKDAKRKRVLLTRLKDSLSKNPVKELIDEGIFQSIVEDVDVEDDQFTYKSKIQEYLTPKFIANGNVPKVLSDIGNNLVMSHETRLYKALRDSTQLSDFVARYTLHQHNLKNGMGKAESYKKIVDTFINYELPTHKGIQYANDMGFVMFTKFFVRIQKVIANLASEKTANFITLILLQQTLDTDVEDIFDSFVSPDTVGNKFHSPYDVGSTLLDLPLINFVEGTVG